MSSQRSDDGAEAAVDGNTTQTESSGTCALTDLHGLEAWWSVDLNDTYAISQLRIYLLNTNIFRFRYYSVHVTDNLDYWNITVPCAENRNPGGSLTSVVQVNCDAKGRYVTIWLNRPLECRPLVDNNNFCDILQLCEVQVFGCQPGNYSQNCNKTCPVNCRDAVCAIDNGRCYSCKDGYLGDNCDQSVIPGVLVTIVTRIVAFTAKISVPTSMGFVPTVVWMDTRENTAIKMKGNFKKACSNGRYGSGCNESCGHCLSNAACDVFSGQCPSGCESGWIGGTCKTSCPDGTYGFQCNGECGQNCLSACNKSTGLCDVGCGNGWKGSYCNECCRFQKYGVNCSIICDFCDHGCDRVNGECLHKGISESFQGTTFLPWVFFGIACVITLSLAIVIVLQYRRYEGRGHQNSIPDELCRHERHGTNASTNAGNQNTTYEELQTQRSQRNAYDIIQKQASTYENTALS